MLLQCVLAQGLVEEDDGEDEEEIDTGEDTTDITHLE